MNEYSSLKLLFGGITISISYGFMKGQPHGLATAFIGVGLTFIGVGLLHEILRRVK